MHLFFSEFLDIDECEESGLCGHNARCMNTEGSYMCYCNDGYKLETGERSFRQDGNIVSCKGESLLMLFLLADKIAYCTVVYCLFWPVLLQGRNPFFGLCLLCGFLVFFFFLFWYSVCSSDVRIPESTPDIPTGSQQCFRCGGSEKLDNIMKVM